MTHRRATVGGQPGGTTDRTIYRAIRAEDISARKSMTEIDQLRAEAERVRASGKLGRGGPLLKLFDFLLEQSIAGRAPKEAVIAIDVFGKTSFDVSQDAIVRVYVHKLRRKLDEFYAATDAKDAMRLAVPKGEYRLTLQVPTEPAARRELSVPDSGWLRRLLMGLLVALLLNAAIMLAGWWSGSERNPDLQQARSSPVWSAMLDDDLPIAIVVGDYFLFGEIDQNYTVKRLLRDFTINSPMELEAFTESNPDAAMRYVSLGLSYLPTSTAFALRDVMPLVADTGKHPRSIRVVLMSELTPMMLKRGHVIFIGCLSGLGDLEKIVFSRSRFAIGDSYDEFVDRPTGRHFVSQAGKVPEPGTMFKDYGYMAAFDGPDGNRFVVIAGTRDVAVMQVADALTTGDRLKELRSEIAGATAFEALYEVEGVNQTNLMGRLIVAAPLDSKKMWNAGATQVGAAGTQ